MKLILKNLSVLVLILLLIFNSSCNRNPDRALVISKLKNSAKLASVEYVVSKVITTHDQNWLAKDAYFFAETQASIKAGIDLDKLQEEDIKIDGTRISILLPPIEIINFSYPAEGFKVIKKYTDQAAIFKWNTINVASKDDLYRQGEADIRESIDDLGIVKTAQKNTRLLLTSILRLSGFDEIYISFKKSEKLNTQDENLLKELQEFLNRKKS